MKTDEEIKFEISEYGYEDQEYSPAEGIKSSPVLAEQEKEVSCYEDQFPRQIKGNNNFVDYSGGLMGI